MGFFDFLFGRKTSPESSASSEVFDAATARAVLAEIDIDSAIAAHENWKVRLTNVLSGTSSEQLKPEVVCLDDRCDLGKWLHGAGRERLGQYPAFTLIIARHKQFHLEASTVLAKSQGGDLAGAQTMLAGSYSLVSQQVVALLKHLKTGLSQNR